MRCNIHCRATLLPVEALPFLISPIVLTDYERLHFRPDATLKRVFTALRLEDHISPIGEKLAVPAYKFVDQA